MIETWTQMVTMTRGRRSATRQIRLADKGHTSIRAAAFAISSGRCRYSHCRVHCWQTSPATVRRECTCRKSSPPNHDDLKFETHILILRTTPRNGRVECCVRITERRINTFVKLSAAMHTWIAGKIDITYC